MNADTSCASAGAQPIGSWSGGVIRLLSGRTFGLANVIAVTGLLCAAAPVCRAQWSAQDIGTVAAAGSSASNGGTVTVSGSGADIWFGADAFQFYSQPISGDVVITARIASMTDPNGWAKAGVMIRQSLDANSPNVFLAATPEWKGIVGQQRSTPGGDTTSVSATNANAPYWLRLIRSGSGVTAATSPDGATWTNVYNFSAVMNPTVYVGLAVTSHNDGVLCTAMFDNVSVIATGGSTTPPTTPTGLAAVAASWSQIGLSWTNGSYQTGIQIERGTDGVSFAEIATVAGGYNSYSDAGLNSSTTYYYRVRAVNSSGASAYSNVASATTSAPPPPPSGAWQSLDIGTSTAGQTSASVDSVTLTGSGHDIWNTADGFRYYYQPTPTGDCEVIVRVASLQDTDPSGWAKAGIMLRASLDPGSPQAWVCVSAEHGTAFQWRQSASGETQSTTPTEDGTAPRWLKLVFSAAGADASEPVPPTVTGYVSHDGLSWTSAGSFWLPYPPGAWPYIGLAVTSHNDGTLCTAQFDNLRVITPPPAPTNFAVTHRGPNGEIDLAWSYSTTDVDRFVIRTNQETAGSHDWYVAATLPGSARQAVIQIGNTDGAAVQIKAMRDQVRSAATQIWAKPTITPSLVVTGSTSSSISLHITEQYGYNGGEGGPWSIERSSDGVNFVEIVSGLTPTGGTAYSYTTDYTDTGLPAGVTRYYRARELRTNGDSSAYSTVASATTTLSGTSPAAPTALTVKGIASNQIQLGWTDNATNETSYQLERSGDGTTFSLLATLGANSTQYTDNSVVASTTYYYRVRAVNDAGASPYSNTVSVQTAAATGTTGWQSRDIGSVAARGSTTSDSSGSSVTVSGSGADIWGTADAFQFAYQTMSTDGTLTVRLASMTDTNGWAKAGIMVRQTLDANAPNLFVGVTPEWHGVVAQARSSVNDGTTQWQGPAANAPYWLRLTRSGGTFSAQVSPDGATWTTLFNPFNMPSPVYIGFAVTSHNDGVLCTAMFDHVSFVSGGVPVVVNVTPPPNGTYTAGAALNVIAYFSTAVNVTGTPSIALTIGSTVRQAAYVSGSGTANLVFRYVVATSDSDTDGISIASPIALNGGTIKDSAGTNATLAFNPPDTSQVLVNGSGSGGGSWSSGDIGAVGIAGSDTASGTTITINGSGADIWDTADAFHFVWRSWTGDGVVEAQVASMGNTNGWAKAGVMIRETLSADARNVFVPVTPSWAGIVAQARSNPGGVTAQTAGPGNNAPYWVRVARSGSTFTASTSPDGVTWTPFATYNVTMGSTVYFGFAVTSHDNTQLNQAVFQNPYVGTP